nr:hypothetical protein [Stenotrophomonas sp. YIM B06876]
MSNIEGFERDGGLRCCAKILSVRPFRVLMKNGATSYLILAIITYLISLFFRLTPAAPLVCAALLSAAIAVGLPPLMSAATIKLCALRPGRLCRGSGAPDCAPRRHDQ